MANISVEHVDEQVTKADAPVKNSGRKQKPNSKKQQILFGLVVLALIGVTAYMVVDRMRLSKEVDKLSQTQSQQSPEDEAKQLASEVSKLIVLPTDEIPTIATVTDASKVKDKPFFANAQNGDKVLLYAKASKAVLYRPSANKLIEVSALNLSEAQSTTENQGTSKTSR